MSFYPFLFKKDVIRLKGLLWVWGVFMLMELVTGIMGADLIMQSIAGHAYVLYLVKVIHWADVFLTILIIPLLIHDDSLVGSTAFWLTRPISKKGLLVTKTSFIAVVLVLFPMLVEIGVLFFHGFSMQVIMAAIPEMILERLVNVIPLAIIAAMTLNIRQYFLALFMFVVLFSWTIFSILFHFMSIFQDAYSFVLPSALLSKSIVLKIFICIWGAGVLMHQFMTRKTFQTLIFILAGIMMCLCTLIFWQWDFLKAGEQKINARSDIVEFNVMTDLRHVFIQDELQYEKDKERQKKIWAKQTINGMKQENFAVLKRLDQVSMTYPDGHILESAPIMVTGQEYINDTQDMIPLQAAFGQDQIVNPYVGKGTHKPIFLLNDAEFQEYKVRKGVYKAKANYGIYRYQKMINLPLAIGQSINLGFEQIEIFDIVKNPTGVSVYISNKAVSAILGGNSNMVGQRRETGNDFRHVYFLYNPKHHQGFIVEQNQSQYYFIRESYGSDRLSQYIQRLDFTHVNARNEGLPQITDRWLKDAVLVRMDAVKIGEHEKDIKFRNFYIPGTATVNTQ